MSDNELIAEFMDAPNNPMGKNFTLDAYLNKGLYHNSWDWLMPVVERINEPEVNGDQVIRSPADVQIMYKACHIAYVPDEDFEDRDEWEIQTQAETKIEAVYKAVVEFIKWYNESKQNQS